MVIWRGRPDCGPDSAILASFQLTRRQALGRRLSRGWLGGLVAVPLLGLSRWGAVACLAGATTGLVRGGAGAAVEVDDRGLRAPRIGWEEIVEVYPQRRGRRTVAALRLESGAAVRLPVTYDGCLFAHDPAFEDKLFTLRQLWETHRRWRKA